MKHKMSKGADLLLTIWVMAVAVIFFGPLFAPVIGFWTATGSLLYLLMIGISAAVFALKFLRRRSLPSKPE